MKLSESIGTRREFLAAGGLAAVMAALSQIGCSTREKIAEVQEPATAEKPESKEAAEIRTYIESLPDEMTIDSGRVSIEKHHVKGSRHLIIAMPRFHELHEAMRRPDEDTVKIPKLIAMLKKEKEIEVGAKNDTSRDCAQIARQFVEQHGISYVGREGEAFEEWDGVLKNFEKLRMIAQKQKDRQAYIEHVTQRIAALPENDPSLAHLRLEIRNSQDAIRNMRASLEPVWEAITENDPVFADLIREQIVLPLPTEDKEKHAAHLQQVLSYSKHKDDFLPLEEREMASMKIMAGFGNRTGDRKTLVCWGANHWMPKNGGVCPSMQRWNAENPNESFSLVIATPPTLKHWFGKVDELKADRHALERQLDDDLHDMLEKFKENNK